MQEITPSSVTLPKPSRTSFFLSLILLIAVVGLSIGFFAYNMILEKSIDQKKSEIWVIKRSIDDLSRDRTVILTKIEQSGDIRPSIDLKGIVDSFYEAATNDRVRLKGFSIANDVIATTLISTEPYGITHPDPAGTIIEMMRKYARGTNGRFRLEPISMISGNLESRTTPIQFQVVSVPTP